MFLFSGLLRLAKTSLVCGNHCLTLVQDSLQAHGLCLQTRPALPTTAPSRKVPPYIALKSASLRFPPHRPLAATESMSGPFSDGGPAPVCRMLFLNTRIMLQDHESPFTDLCPHGGSACTPHWGESRRLWAGWLRERMNTHRAESMGRSPQEPGSEQGQGSGLGEESHGSQSLLPVGTPGIFPCPGSKNCPGHGPMAYPWRSSPQQQDLPLSSPPSLLLSKVGMPIGFLRFQNKFITICKGNRRFIKNTVSFYPPSYLFLSLIPSRKK